MIHLIFSASGFNNAQRYAAAQDRMVLLHQEPASGASAQNPAPEHGFKSLSPSELVKALERGETVRAWY